MDVLILYISLCYIFMILQCSFLDIMLWYSCACGLFRFRHKEKIMFALNTCFVLMEVVRNKQQVFP